MKTKNVNKIAAPLVFMIIMIQLGNICKAQDATIKYSSFQVDAVKNRIMIHWVTDKKSPTNYFEIQRSQDGKNFKTIELVLGPDPRQDDCQCFAGIDKVSDNNQKYYYRLKHISIDGSEEFGEVAVLASAKKI